MKPKQQELWTFVLRLPPEWREKLEYLAKRDQRSIAFVIREAIEQRFDKEARRAK